MTRQDKLTARFEDALCYAFNLHSAQKRKGTDVPYFSHLMSVAALVLEDGGDEDQAIAGLLHDAVEDQGGLETLAEIRRRYGERVAEIVLACSDTTTFPKPPWRKRKEDYLAHLPLASEDIRRVSLADKVHNARSILRDLLRDGDGVWERFKGGKEGTLWYYRSLVEIFQQTDFGPNVRELARLVHEMETIEDA